MSESLLSGAAAAAGDGAAQEPQQVAAPAPEKGAGAEAGGWQDGLSEELRGVAQARGWKTADDAVRAFNQLNDFLGAEKAGRGLVVPADEKDEAGWKALYDRLGRPESAEGYGLADALAGKEVDTGFLGSMGQAMYDAGLSKGQAQKMALAYQGQYEAALQAADQRHEAEAAEVARTFAKGTLENARRAWRASGLSDDQAKAIEMALGVKTAVELFAKIGGKLAEDRPPEGASGPGQLGLPTTPAAAQARMDELLADPSFVARYQKGEANAMRIMEELSIRASGERN